MDASAQPAFELAPLQQGMLFHYLYAPHSGVDVEQLLIELPEAFDAGRFATALQTIVARHEALRTSFHWEGLSEPRQQVQSQAEVPISVHDWSQHSTEERESQWRDFLAADRSRGFDLSRAPLTRLTVFRYGATSFRLVWTFHHIVVDGSSYVLLLDETFRLYDALRSGAQVELPPATPFRAYIDWLHQQKRAHGPQFWRQQLQGIEAPTPLPFDHSAGPTRPVAFDSATEALVLSPYVAASLQAMTTAHRLSPNTILLGAWALLLSRYSQQSDVVFGTIMGARWLGLRGAETMVGAPLTSIPFRVAVAEESQVVAWLQGIWRSWIELAMGYPWKTSLADMKQQSSLGGDTPLFESLLIFDPLQFESSVRARYPEWGARKLHARGNTGYPLSLHAYAGSEFLLNLEYDPQRFEAATIRRMLNQLATILAGFAAGPDQPLAAIEWLGAEEKRQLLVDWNRAATLKELPPLQLAGAAQSSADLPRTETERQLAVIWREVLQVAVPSRSDDFFALGGNSLLAVRLFSRIAAQFQTKLPVSAFFDDPTLEGLARTLDRVLVSETF